MGLFELAEYPNQRLGKGQVKWSEEGQIVVRRRSGDSDMKV